MNYCSECGARLVEQPRFCPGCGRRLETTQESIDTATEKVRLSAAQRRVHPGQLADMVRNPSLLEEWEQDIWVDPDSQEAELARIPFDSTRPPTRDGWVPVDSVWAIAPYPGPPPLHISGKLSSRVQRLGTLTGRPYREIVDALGPPSARTGTIATWQEIGLMKSYAISLSFDSYDICIGVASEVGF